VDQLIEAVDLLRARSLDMLVFLLGRGRYEAPLRRLVQERGLSAKVIFAPPQGDLTSALESADLFVRPTVDAAFQVDTLQAMGAGAAVVTCQSSVCDFLRHGETAALCTQPTAESLADIIGQLATDRAVARQMATAGVEHVRTHHAVSVMAERTAAAYRKLALARATFPIKE
jgi:glycosyltransferase involved in cell wall biosynthesis